MAIRHIALAGALAGLALPASAAILVIGNSSARLCYEAADAPLMPSPTDIARCDSALADDNLGSADTVATYVNRGILRLRRGQTNDAIADFDSATRLDPSQPEAYLNKGIALLRLENSDGALRLFDAAIAHNTRRPELAYFARAIANEMLGNVRAAYNDYRQASQISPNWREPQVELTRFRVVSR
jgi:tetratricopeptide (TPR) repeat protein